MQFALGSLENLAISLATQLFPGWCGGCSSYTFSSPFSLQHFPRAFLTCFRGSFPIQVSKQSPNCSKNQKQQGVSGRRWPATQLREPKSGEGWGDDVVITVAEGKCSAPYAIMQGTEYVPETVLPWFTSKKKKLVPVL